MIVSSRLSRDLRGAAAMEFALIAPAFVALIMAVAQLGMLFFANAGLSNAIAEGARIATLHPRPTVDEIKTKINASRFGLDPKKLSTPTLSSGTSLSSDYHELTMSYTVNISMIFVDLPAIKLKQTRRVYLQPIKKT